MSLVDNIVDNADLITKQNTPVKLALAAGGAYALKKIYDKRKNKALNKKYGLSTDYDNEFDQELS